jgi:4-hydroxy-4-methyl-2-oxoglutarate aldolase
MTAPAAEALAGLDAATLHEAQGRSGALPPAIKPVDPGFRVAGPAYPVSSPPGDNFWIHHAVARAQPGAVLVVDVHGAGDFGYWGEILSHAAAARGIGGLVIDGGVRDAGRLREVGFPVFATGLCLTGTAKDPRGAGTLGTPVVLGSVAVRTGDLVVGDADGVVVVPAGDVDRVVAAALGRAAAEREVLARLEAGETTIDIFDLEEPG